MLQRYPNVAIRTYPSTELLPTLVTGVYPDRHGVWQVSLKDDAQVRHTPMARLLDRLPDAVTSSAQCLANFFLPEMELAAIPYRRRRRFELHRFKYTRRAKRQAVMTDFNGVMSIFGVVRTSAYRFGKRFDRLDGLIQQLPTPGLELEMIEFYAFDIFSHWHMDQPDAIADAMRRTDAMIQRMRQRCNEAGVTFVLLVDHGQEEIRGQIDVKRLLSQSGVPGREYTYFVEVGVTRLWFHTEQARQAITGQLRNIANLDILTAQEMRQYHVDMPAKFGHLYVYPKHGYAFFPHDFYQPLANLYLGLSHDAQRPRAFNPRHRGNHGHLPNHPAEDGYMIVADDSLAAADSPITIIDVAPTLLQLIGYKPPPHMTGAAAFIARSETLARV